MVQTLHFPVLNPGDSMPKGVEFCTTLSDAIMRVDRKELFASIWRPPYRDQLVQSYEDMKFGGIYPNAGFARYAYRRIYSEEFLKPESTLQQLFQEAQDELFRYFNPDIYKAEPVFTLRGAGNFDIVHCDDLVHIQMLVVIKGQGTWCMSPIELEESGIALPDEESFMENYPVHLVYEFSKGDVVFWRNDFPHSPPMVVRPENERLVGTISVLRKPM